MAYRSTRDCIEDLERNPIGTRPQLVRISQEVSPHLEMAEIQRRLYLAGGPAVLFENVAGSPFPAVANLFGTLDRCHFIFRKTLRAVESAIAIKADPSRLWRNPLAHWRAPLTALTALPRPVRTGPALTHRTRISQLPQIRSWPDDGGPYITLPQVYSEDPDDPRPMRSNLGMYRVQLSGNQYCADKEVGLHYQIHRGIGIHHAQAMQRGEPLRVSVFIGGPPAHTLAAIMPLPEGLSELLFAGMLAGRRVRLAEHNGHRVAVDADFCLVGTIDPSRTAPEGPFGDHLGYYSLTHDFPVMTVEEVYHRPDPIWPFTVVGRPPQEDTVFGHLIHELTAPMVPVSLPGLKAMHAVDEAGVHPLLLAIGSERYTPYRRDRPAELLTIANAILGFGQASLAKFLIILAAEDLPDLDIRDVGAVLRALLERIDWRRDLHFYTKTTIDTLDYSGEGLNQGSKVVMAATGVPRRTLSTTLLPGFDLPTPFTDIRIAHPGVVVIEGPAHPGIPLSGDAPEDLTRLQDAIDPALVKTLPLVILVDDADFCARSLKNLLWVTFTRANPSHDIHGVQSFMRQKHWGCAGPLIIDARIKAHHAPPLLEDPAITRRVDALAARGGPLAGLIA